MPAAGVTAADPALDPSPTRPESTAPGPDEPRSGVSVRAIRLLDGIERGRRPMVIAVGASAALAVMTSLRFVALVRLLPPAEYGRLNIFMILTSVAPQAMALAMPWQYQRVARREGAAVVGSLCRSALMINAISTLPTLIALVAIITPIAGQGHPWAVAILLLAISVATSITSMYASVALGLGRRSLSSLLMFAINAGLTVAVLPIAIVGTPTVAALLGWTAAVCLGVAVAARLALRRIVQPWPTTRRRGLLSFREGLFSLPAVVGPLAFVLSTRYLLGVNVSVDAVAMFAICSTVAEMAFLVSAAGLTHFSNRVLDGQQSPMRGFLLVLTMYSVLTISGVLLVALILPGLGRGEYHVSWPALIVLSLVGVPRLHFSAWRARAVGLRRAHRSAWIYVVIVVLGTGTLALARPDGLLPYALMLLGGFTVAAAAQWVNLRAASWSPQHAARRSRGR